MRRLTLALPALVLAGCSMTPAYERPTAVVPPSWPVGDAYLRQSEAALPTLTFEQVFTDPRLRTLVGQALVNNRDLRIAAANIRAARAQYRIQRADLFPQLDASGRYSYRGTGDGATTTTIPGTGTGTGGTGTGTGTGGTIVTSSQSPSSFSLDLGTTAFEIDLFGRIRSLTEAEQNRYFATEAGARATRLTLVGDIAQTWAAYGADRSLMTIAEATAASARRSVTLTRARLQGGVAPRTDLRQAEQILATAESDLAEQRTQLAQDINALQLLVGSAISIDPALLPASIDIALPTIADVPAGIDSGILLRRPDVVQAEYELLAANADIGAARAALFPRLSLTGLVGFASDALRTLFTGGAFNYSVAPAVSYPIFRAGAGRAGVEFSTAQRDALLASYERTIQSAFREVSDALARQGTIAEQTRADRANLIAAEDTFRLTEARYRGGIDTFLSSLDAQRSYYTAQRRLVATQLVAATNRVTLYRTLGGDSLLEAGPDGPVAVVDAAGPSVATR